MLVGAAVAALAVPTSTDAQIVCLNCSTEITTILVWIQKLLNDAREIALETSQLQQEVTTYRSIVGARDVGGALNAMAGQGIQNPLPSDPQSVMGLIGGVANQAPGLSGDLRGQQLATSASSISGIQSLVQKSWQSAADGLQQLGQARSGLSGASDLKDVADRHASISLTQSEATRQQTQAVNAQTLAMVQPRVFEQQSEEADRRDICQEINYLRGNEDGAAPPVNCPAVSTSSSGAIASGGYGAPGGLAQPAVYQPSSAGGTNALGTMMAQPWGQAASDNATAIGVNPQALAATCVVESNCQNVSNPGSSASGPFQMLNSSFSSSLAEARAQNPDLNLSGDKSDPATEAAAAAQYLKTSATQLRAAGVPNPTASDVRASYNFGSQYGAQVARADPSQDMSSILSGMSPATLAANGITPGLSVAAWRQSVANKMGSAANAPVLLPST